MKKYLLFILLQGLTYSASCQKYNFVNWTVEDGLIQSQASNICQDKYRQLWIGTEGGICKFDGKKFTGYSAQEGLVANHINLVFCDNTGNLWIGTDNGISIFNGHSFKNIKPGKGPVNNVTAICQANDSNLVALTNFKAYKIKDFKAEKINLSGDTGERVTSLSRCQNGTLLAFVHGKGLYAMNGLSAARKLCSIEEKYKKTFFGTITITSKNDTLLIGSNNLFKLVQGKVQPYGLPIKDTDHINVLCMAEDSKGKLWLGSDNGVYKIEGEQLTHFNSKSGITDNSVNYIYKDVENNLWFATDADGIYKFRENTFTYFDKSSGLQNPIVMGITQTKQGLIYVGGYGGGLYKVNTNNSLEVVANKGPVLADSKIYCLYADDEDNVWIGTINKGIWKYNAKQGLEKLEARNDPNLILRGATCMYKDRQGNLIIGSNQGLYIKNKNNDMNRVKLSNSGVATSIIPFNNDSLLIGTSKGLYFLNSKYEAHLIPQKAFSSSYVLCLAKQNGNIWIGTPDKGVLNWDYKTDRVINYTTANGLPSNFIYSIYISQEKKAWIGTGFGICNLQLNSNLEVSAIKNYGRSDGLLGMECSHNCLLRAADSSLWFGTTKGLFHFNPYTNLAEKNAPLILLKSVKLFSSGITDSTLYTSMQPWFEVPQELKLKPRQNHVSFELGSIYFTNPEDVIYKYKLDGIDKAFTTSSNPVIIYPALPPGKYTLKVTGLTKSGLVSLNEIEYKFEIEKAFYQTRFFQLMVVLLLLLTGGLMAYILTRGRQKRKQKAKELLAQIREEEFVKLRQRTAEDFHDEMGNSLTRISVLTDILKSKINTEQGDINKLVQQIKENTTALYNGSKDIIWSLNSKNDGLYEIAVHIKEIGQELFNETNIDFNYTHNISEDNRLKLKLDYSRNLTMIFKEAYSNILKYSKANTVSVNLELIADNCLLLSLHDNGIGFNINSVQQGNGLKNMENRVKRMNGELEIESGSGQGTHINIKLNTLFI